MKWHHAFHLEERGSAFRIYRGDGWEARLDFFRHMMRVALYPANQADSLFPTYSICPEDSVMPRHGRERLSTDGLCPLPQKDDLRIGDVDVTVAEENLRIEYRKNGKLLFADRQGLAYNFEGELGTGSYHYITREEGERIYGLGDKTGSVNKAGRRFRMETADAMGFDASSSDPLYKQIPFYICKNSVGSYGLFYDTYSNGELDLGSEINNYYPPFKWARFEEQALVYYVLFGTVPEILQNYMKLTGKAALPPEWSFRYAGSTMSYTDAPDADRQLHGFLDKIRTYGIDCGGFYLSSGYTQIGDKRYVFHWNKDKIPSPEKLSSDFREQGIRILPNVKPAFLTDHPLYDRIAANGWFLHYADGTPAVFPFWGGEGSYLDFTNDGAFDFWTECVRTELVSRGYDSIWNDNNEYDVRDEDVWADGFGYPIRAKRIRPLFSLLMAMASRAAVPGEDRIMAVSRSGIAGTERIAQTWTGDNRTSFTDFRSNHRMAMTMALSGFRLFGQDVCGFAGPKPDRELFLRWIQYGLFTPRFVLHSWKEDGTVTMPWLYEDLMPAVQKLFRFRATLIPYLYSEANRAVETYAPLLSPLFLTFPNESDDSDWFLCGQSILCCPVFDPDVRELTVGLPDTDGGWYRNGEWFDGTVTVQSPPDDLPVFFIRCGSVLPLMEEGTVFHVFPPEKGELKYAYYDDPSAGNRCRVLRVECGKDTVSVTGLRDGERAVLHDRLGRTLTAVCNKEE